MNWEGRVLTGSMTSTFLTDGSGATAGQSASSWYPVALLLRLWERVPSWKRSRSERKWQRNWSKGGNKLWKMKQQPVSSQKQEAPMEEKKKKVQIIGYCSFAFILPLLHSISSLFYSVHSSTHFLYLLYHLRVISLSSN